MDSISLYRQVFEDYMGTQEVLREPVNLYAPVDYILSLGGKRMRPILTLMAADLFGADFKNALPAAMAVEMFHNFSLVHDDIMDDAPLRRGNATVHQKWNLNAGILSGDAMLILAYQYFEQYEPKVFAALARLFSKTALEVCEGQQWDVDFETREDVTIDDYLRMIRHKTAVLVAAALKMGAIIADTTPRNCDAIYEFGLNLGIAFQLQDDYLDVFGDPESFGKQAGGDIIENKKTYLYLSAIKGASAEDHKSLAELYTEGPHDPSHKIAVVSQIFNDSGAARVTQEAIGAFTEKAFLILDKLDIADERKTILRNFGNQLMQRTV